MVNARENTPSANIKSCSSNHFKRRVGSIKQTNTDSLAVQTDFCNFFVLFSFLFVHFWDIE